MIIIHTNNSIRSISISISNVITIFPIFSLFINNFVPIFIVSILYHKILAHYCLCRHKIIIIFKVNLIIIIGIFIWIERINVNSIFVNAYFLLVLFV